MTAPKISEQTLLLVASFVACRGQTTEEEIRKQFHLSDTETINALRTLQRDNQVHKVYGLTGGASSGIWGSGAPLPLEEGSRQSEQIRIRVASWPRPSFRISALEAYLFPSYGVAA